MQTEKKKHHSVAINTNSQLVHEAEYDRLSYDKAVGVHQTILTTYLCCKREEKCMFSVCSLYV